MRQQILVGVILCLTAATSDAALLGRAPLTPGGTDYQAYYDTALDITWTADANFALSENYGQGPFITSDGQMEWSNAVAWLAGMNAAQYLGIDDWRFPATFDVGAPGCNYPRDPLPYAGYADQDCGYNVNPDTSEMAHLYYVTLGNLSYYTTTGEYTTCGLAGNCLSNTGPFSNLGPETYWSGTQVVGLESVNFIFGFRFGVQNLGSGGTPLNVWAVHDGDPLAAPVPLPAALWLLGSALGVLAFVRRSGRLTG